jgi:hypothetical protein
MLGESIDQYSGHTVQPFWQLLLVSPALFVDSLELKVGEEFKPL